MFISEKKFLSVYKNTIYDFYINEKFQVKHRHLLETNTKIYLGYKAKYENRE